jgi:hypothetical protein
MEGQRGCWHSMLLNGTVIKGFIGFAMRADFVSRKHLMVKSKSRAGDNSLLFEGQSDFETTVHVLVSFSLLGRKSPPRSKRKNLRELALASGRTIISRTTYYMMNYSMTRSTIAGMIIGMAIRIQHRTVSDGKRT